MVLGVLALVTAALFINFSEHPARLGLDDRALLAQWKPSYARGFALDHAGPDGRALIVRWGGLHARRTTLGFIATGLFLWAILVAR